MDSTERYNKYALCREMRQTADVVRNFPVSTLDPHSPRSRRVLITGEGSSRIFPAKRLIAEALREDWDFEIVTEGATQALEYALADRHVYVASNSGKTAEGVRLLRSAKPTRTTGVVAYAGTPIAEESDTAYVLGCGPEDAVAATKSVVEQALVYDALFRGAAGAKPVDTKALADGIDSVLSATVPAEMVERAVSAPVLYFAGRNDGVAEELTLKTNEITRKRSDYLEGTYAVHGIEEVMDPDQLVILVDPFPQEEEKVRRVLVDGVGMSVMAIADRETSFPTMVVPRVGALAPYLQLVAGWSFLVEVGIAAGVDLDRPARARKVGNEFEG